MNLGTKPFVGLLGLDIMGMIRLVHLVAAAALLYGCASSNNGSGIADKKRDQAAQYEQHSRDVESGLPEETKRKLAQHGDLMDYLAANMKWNHHVERKEVQKMIRFYAGKPKYLTRSFERGQRYLYHIIVELEKHNMPLELALLPLVESAYRPYAKSPKLAAGLWQFIPATGKRYKLGRDYWQDQRYDPVEATRAALHYLHDLVKMYDGYDGRWFLAMASYNWGERNVQRKLKQNKAVGKKADFWNIRKPGETARYVPSLLALAEIVKNPEKYNVNLPPIANTPYFEAVRLRRPIDLGIAAKLAGMSMQELYVLNGGLKRWLRPPHAPARLLVPVGKAATLREKLAQLEDDQWLLVKKHKVAKGEDILSIAGRYGLDTTLLKGINPYLRKQRPKAGEIIDIPQPKFARGHYAVRNAGNEIQPGRGQRIVHKVKKGESLWLIARKYSTTVSKIKQWNGRTSSLLRPGQKLVVWTGKAAPPLVGNGSYRVQRGDTLSAIASKFGIRLSQLLTLNNIANANKLRVGQKLRIGSGGTKATAGSAAKTKGKALAATKIDYTVKRGDSLWSIAKRYNVSVKTLLAWNSLKAPPRYLRPGQLLQIVTGK